jgi:hypothetical protein
MPPRVGYKPRPARGSRIAGGALAAILIAVLGAWWFARSARERWVRNQALPQLEDPAERIQGLEEGRESWDAKVRYPRGFTRIELTLPGKLTSLDVLWNFQLLGDTWSYRLQAPGAVPDQKALVPAGAFELYLPGLESLKAEPTTAFLMDRHEVSQREYKRFVDAGGYTDPKYWQQPFVDGDRTLTWNEAIARFTDRTGRPGPATWEVGSYADDGGDLPVSGVSWYGAAAYAERLLESVRRSRSMRLTAASG